MLTRKGGRATESQDGRTGRKGFREETRRAAWGQTPLRCQERSEAFATCFGGTSDGAEVEKTRLFSLRGLEGKREGSWPVRGHPAFATVEGPNPMVFSRNMACEDPNGVRKKEAGQNVRLCAQYAHTAAHGVIHPTHLRRVYHTALGSGDTAVKQTNKQTTLPCPHKVGFLWAEVQHTDV